MTWIYRVIKKVKWIINFNALKITKDKYFNFIRIYNVETKFKRAHLNNRIYDIKIS